MRYEMEFIVNGENSGKATYLGHMAGGNSPPYQFDKGNNMVKQYFSFASIEMVNDFLKKVAKEIGLDPAIFYILSLKPYSYKKDVEGGHP